LIESLKLGRHLFFRPQPEVDSMLAKKAAPAKTATQATITLKHLAAALAEDHEMPRKQAEAVLGDLVTLTTKHLKKGRVGARISGH
jgi:hypothetical protein